MSTKAQEMQVLLLLIWRLKGLVDEAGLERHPTVLAKDSAKLCLISRTDIAFRSSEEARTLRPLAACLNRSWLPWWTGAASA